MAGTDTKTEHPSPPAELRYFDPEKLRLVELAPKLDKDQIIVVCLSGRGDKDVTTVAAALGQQGRGA
jgi:hypothetical protein